MNAKSEIKLLWCAQLFYIPSYSLCSLNANRSLCTPFSVMKSYYFWINPAISLCSETRWQWRQITFEVSLPFHTRKSTVKVFVTMCGFRAGEHRVAAAPCQCLSCSGQSLLGRQWQKLGQMVQEREAEQAALILTTAPHSRWVKTVPTGKKNHHKWDLLNISVNY